MATGCKISGWVMHRKIFTLGMLAVIFWHKIFDAEVSEQQKHLSAPFSTFQRLEQVFYILEQLTFALYEQYDVKKLLIHLLRFQKNVLRMRNASH